MKIHSKTSINHCILESQAYAWVWYLHKHVLFPLKEEPWAKSFFHKNDPKYSDRQVWENSVDPDQIAPEEMCLHCLSFHLHL